MKYQNAEIKAGAFVLLAGVAFLGLFVWISGYANAILHPQVRYYTRLADAEGLNAGAIVHFAGIPAGRLISLAYHPLGIPREHFDKMKLSRSEDAADNLEQSGDLYTYAEDDGRYVLAIFTVERVYLGALGQGATVEVQLPIFGGATLNIIPGSGDSTELAVGGYIPGESSTMAKVIGELGSLKDRFTRISDQLESVLTNVDRLTSEDASLDRTLGNFEKVSANLIDLSESLRDRVERLLSGESIAGIESAVGSLDRFLAELERSTTAHLEPALANIESMSARADTMIAENSDRLGQMLESAEGAFSGFDTLGATLVALAEDLRASLGDENSGVLAISESLGTTLQNADGLIAEVRSRVHEFRWSYLHYMLFAPDADEAAAGRLVDLGRELVLGQEQMSQAIARLDGILSRGAPLDPELRRELEDERRQLAAGLERADALQEILYRQIEERAGSQVRK